MLVTRSFKVVRNTEGESPSCFFCPLDDLCKKYVSHESGEVNYYLINDSDYSERDYIKKNALIAATCKKSFPNYRVVETTPKEIHRIVGRGGNTIVEAHSSLGLIGKYFLVTIGACVVFIIIALVFCGIANIFN